jgi:hypothetical protein
MGAAPAVAAVLAALTGGQVLETVRADVSPRAGIEQVVAFRLPGRPARCPRGYGVIVRSGSTAIARSRFHPRWMRGALCGSEFRWLRARRLTGGKLADLAFDVLLTPSIGEEMHVLRIAGGSLRSNRIFHADRISLSGERVVLSWITAARGPNGTTARQVWAWRGGAWRLVAQTR